MGDDTDKIMVVDTDKWGNVALSGMFDNACNLDYLQVPMKELTGKEREKELLQRSISSLDVISGVIHRILELASVAEEVCDKIGGHEYCAAAVLCETIDNLINENLKHILSEYSEFKCHYERAKGTCGLVSEFVATSVNSVEYLIAKVQDREKYSSYDNDFYFDIDEEATKGISDLEVYLKTISSSLKCILSKLCS